MNSQAKHCLSKASRTIKDVLHYGLSFNVSPHKKIDGKCYKLYNKDEQKAILLNILQNECMDVLEEPIENYVFELTKAGNIHIHGMVKTVLGNMETIQKSINEKYGYKKDPIDRVLHFSQTVIHRSFWHKYMEKDQKPSKKTYSPTYIPDAPFRAFFSQ